MEKMIIPTHDEMETVNAEAACVEDEINGLLNEQSYDRIISRFKDKDVRILAAKNQRIYILDKMFRLIDSEINSNGNTSLKGKNTSQLIRLYRIMGLYLRRIEFDLSQDRQIEIIEYISSEKLSPEIVVGITTNTDLIIHKEKVLKRLIALMGKYYEG